MGANHSFSSLVERVTILIGYVRAEPPAGRRRYVFAFALFLDFALSPNAVAAAADWTSPIQFELHLNIVSASPGFAA
jgi:hypothetical protein